MPRHHIEWAVVLCAFKEYPLRACGLISIVIEESQIWPQALGSHGYWQDHWHPGAQTQEGRIAPPDFSDISAGWAIWEGHPEANATGDNEDLTGLDEERPKFRVDVERARCGIMSISPSELTNALLAI